MTLLVTALMLMAPTLVLFASNGSAQGSFPVGMAIVDISFSSDCSIVTRMYETSDFTSAVIDEQVEACPAGTVIRSTPVASEQAAAEMGGLFVPLSGDNDADLAALTRAKSKLMPPKASASVLAQPTTAQCDDRGFSRSFSYYAYDPGVTVYSTVYTSQDYTCRYGLSSAVASLSWDANLWWRWADYFSNPHYYNDHGCTNLSTGSTYDGYHVYRPSGYLYVDESTNDSPCWAAEGESYTGSIYL